MTDTTTTPTTTTSYAGFTSSNKPASVTTGPAGYDYTNPDAMSGQGVSDPNTEYAAAVKQQAAYSPTVVSNATPMNNVPSIVKTSNTLTNTGVRTDAQGNPTYANGTIVQNQPPAGWDAQTYANFKAANPSLEPTTQDTATMKSTTGQGVPPGWDPVTYANFKAANPGLNVTSQDTLKMTSAPANPLGSNSPTSPGGYYNDTYYPPGANLPLDAQGSPVPLTATSATNDKVMQNLQDLKGQSDALTASAIDAVTTQYNNLIKNQELNNQGAQNSLLMSGTAQFAPSAVFSQVSEGVNEIANLTAKEQAAILAVKQAGYQNNYQLMSKMNEVLQGIQKDKVDAVTKLNDKITTANEDLQKQKIQSNKDNAISSLYSKGITDVASILASPEAKALNLSAKDIADTVARIVPLGLDDLIKTMRNNGAPADVIATVTSSKDINEAYKNAGVYAAGGTGIIGEYNYYVANAQSKGQTPVDFNTYQNMDANRKAKVAAAGVAANGVPTKPLTEMQAKDLTYAQRASSSNEIINNLASVISNMNPIKYGVQKSLEDTPVGNTLVSNDVQQYRQAERDFVTSILRRESGASISASEFDTAERQYFPRPGDSQKTLDQKENLRKTAIASFEANVPGYDARVNAEKLSLNDLHNNIIQSEDQAQQTLKTFISNNPTKSAEIHGHIQSMEKTVGRPITTMEFYEAFPEYK